MALQTVVETPEFIKRAGAVGMSEEDRTDIITTLAENPEAASRLAVVCGRYALHGAAAERAVATACCISTRHPICRYTC